MNRTIGLISTNYSVPGFGSVTEVRPAASIPFGGRYRLLDFALSNMVNSRVQTVGLVTPYFYRSIIDHVGAGKPWDLSRKEGGLYILPGTVFGFHEENARFLFRDLLHNLEYLRQGDGDYILVSSGTLVANIDYQPMITRHELEGKPVTLLYKKMQPGEKRPGRYLTLDGDTVAGIRRADEGENLLLDSFIVDKSFLLRMARDYAALDYMDFLDILAHVLPEVAVGCCAFDGYVAFMDGMEDYFRASLDLLDSAVGLKAQILGELLGLVGLLGDLLRGSLLGSGLLLGRGLALSLGHAGLSHELHDDHGSVVALAGPELHDAGVAAGTILEHALGDLLEDLADELLVVQVGDGQTAGVQIAALGPGDHLVDLRADLLGTGLHRLDAVVQEQGGNQAALHSLSVAIVGTELATLLVVSHNSLSPKASN